MSVEIARILVPPPVVPPRGAEWAAALTATSVQIARSLWRGLERVGQARAHNELQRLAAQYSHRPQLAQTLRDAMHHAAMHRDSQH